MASLRKLISIKEDEYNKINNYAQKERITFSEFVRKAANFYIDKQEEIESSLTLFKELQNSTMSIGDLDKTTQEEIINVLQKL